MASPLGPAADIALGHYPLATRTIIHLSDTHFLGSGDPLYGAADTDAGLERALALLAGSGREIAAIVITGDLTDLGEPAAYRRLRAMLEPAAARLGAELVWVMGNHDERPAFAAELLDLEPSLEPQDRVHWIGGLRIIALDTSVPGYHHGDLDLAQLDWLAAQLATPAPEGTLLALHHPPVPGPVELMALLELHNQTAFGQVLEGSDVLAILAGHLHHPMFGLFAGIPVSVASATCYSIDSLAERGSLRGVDGARSLNLVELRETGVTHAVVPVDTMSTISGFPRETMELLVRMTPEARLEAFSRKRTTVGQSGTESMASGVPDSSGS